MAWYADLITDGPVSGSDFALSVRIAAGSTPGSSGDASDFISVRLVGSGSFTASTGIRDQVRFDDAQSGGTGFFYIGTSELGALSSATNWSIKRIELLTKDPIHTTWSSLSASWDNRVSETYS